MNQQEYQQLSPFCSSCQSLPFEIHKNCLVVDSGIADKIYISNITDSSITIKVPALDITNCDLVLPVTEIVIELSDNNENDNSVQTFKMLNNSLELNISLDNLVPFTNYSALIFGRNSLGLFTDMNTTLDFTTLQGPPIAPTNVEVGFYSKNMSTFDVFCIISSKILKNYSLETVLDVPYFIFLIICTYLLFIALFRWLFYLRILLEYHGNPLKIPKMYLTKYITVQNK